MLADTPHRTLRTYHVDVYILRNYNYYVLPAWKEVTENCISKFDWQIRPESSHVWKIRACNADLSSCQPCSSRLSPSATHLLLSDIAPNSTVTLLLHRCRDAFSLIAPSRGHGTEHGLHHTV
jgi:hypothetical protein